MNTAIYYRLRNLVLFICLTLICHNISAQWRDDSNSLFKPITTNIGGESNANLSNKGMSVNKAQNLNSRTSSVNSSILTGPKAIVKKDTLRFTTFSLRWLVPEALDTLTAQEATHAGLSYRYIEKDERGYFGRLECVNGYGKYSTNSPLNETLLIDPDSENNGNMEHPEIVKRMSSVCQWLFQRDDLGRLLQQNAYDANGDLVYSFNLVWTDSLHASGFYTDAWGLPIVQQCDTVSLSTSPFLTFSSEGYNIQIDYIDEEGYPVYNREGVFRTVMAYDSKGNNLERWSCDDIGNRMMNNFGYSGLIRTYDIYNRLITYRKVDTKGTPLPFDIAIVGNDPIEIRYINDRYGNTLSRSYWDSEGEPSCDEDGVHKIRQTYNNRGQVTVKAHYDMQGRPVASDDSERCFTVSEYDERGNRVVLKELETDSITLAKHKQLNSEILAKYDSRGDTIEASTYNYYDGQRIRTRFIRKKNLTGEVWREVFLTSSKGNYYLEVQAFDSNGNLDSKRFLSYPERKPITVPDFGYSIKRYDKVHPHKGVFQYDTYYLNQDSVLCMPLPDENDFAHRLDIYDSIACIQRVMEWDTEGNLTCNLIHYYPDASMSNSSAMQKMNFKNVPGIVGNTGPYSFKLITQQDLYGKIKCIRAYNEWNEPALISNLSWGYHALKIINGKNHFYDENNQRKYLYDNPYSAYIVEVISDQGYQIGLKDGDVLVRFGNAMIEPENENRELLSYECVRLASEASKYIWVLRHDVPNHKSSVLKIKLGKGTFRELGFQLHPVLYTKREAERFTEAREEFESTIGTPEKQSNLEKKSIPYFWPAKQNKYATAYKYHISDPFVVLKVMAFIQDEESNDVEQKVWNWLDLIDMDSILNEELDNVERKVWNVGEDFVKLEKILRDNSSHIKMRIWGTTDGVHIFYYDKDERLYNNDCYLLEVGLTDSQQLPFVQLFNQLDK